MYDAGLWCAQLQAATKIFVRQMEAEWGATFPEGRNPDISFMAHIWEDLRVLPKPLILHLASEGANLAGHAMLRCMGFRKDCCQVPVAPRSCDPALLPFKLQSCAPRTDRCWRKSISLAPGSHGAACC